MYEILFNLIGRIFLLIMLGYFLRKKGFLTAQFHTQLNSFLMTVCVPASIMTCCSNDFSPEISGNMLMLVAINVAYYVGTLIISKVIARFLKLPTNSKSLFVSMVMFPNICFVGFPLAIELMGTEGMLYNTIANLGYVLFFFSIGVSLISGETKMQWGKIIRLPAFVACVIAIAIYVSPFRFPVFMETTFSNIGGMMTPISMMLVGSSLAEIPVVSILKDRCAYLVSALRLIVLPFIVLFILMAIPGIPDNVALHSSLMFCVPTGTMCQIYAHEYDNDPTFASRTLVQGTLLMVITIPLFMTCAISLLGM